VTEPLEKVAHPELARDPTVAEARRAAVMEAIVGYQVIIREFDDRPQSRLQQTGLWFHIGLLYTVIDDRPNVHNAYLTEVGFAEGLVRASPNNAVCQKNAGMAYYQIGMELWYEDRRGKAVVYFSQAVAAFNEALGLDPHGLMGLQHSAWFVTVFPDPRFCQPARALRLAKELVAAAAPLGYDRPHFSGGVRLLFTIGDGAVPCRRLARRSEIARRIPLETRGQRRL
jgi:hypothetical protein